MKHTTIAIIGAGPAGLATAGRLSHRGFKDFMILDAAANVGSSWRKHYDRLHLHTVKQLSYLPHLPFPEEYPLYVSKNDFVSYLEAYTEEFNIVPQFNQQVTKIYKEDGSWKIQTDKDTIIATHVIIATGVNRTPKMPQWPGQGSFDGDIVHSRNYKNPANFKGQKVLIVGMGNTGAELALDLAEHNVPVTISVRSPISIVPRDLNGRPVQLTAKKLAKLPLGLGDWLGTQIRKVYFGNLEKYGLKVSSVSPTVQLKETGKTPIVDIGTVDSIKKGKIKIKSDIKSLEKNEVLFQDETRQAFDSIILATGYTSALEELITDISVSLDQYQCPKHPIGKGPHTGLYFVGFDNYKLGGILGTIGDDSNTIVDKILNNKKL